MTLTEDTCSCPYNNFYSGSLNQCVGCTEGCDTCNQEGCLVCQDGFTKGTTLCLKCEPGYYIEGDSCLPYICKPGCVQCLNGPETCTNCSTSLIYYDLGCVCEDSNSYYDVESDLCVKCPVNCPTCINSDQCSSCSIQYNLSETEECLLKQCAEQMYLTNSGECLPCPSGASICTQYSKETSFAEVQVKECQADYT